MTENVSAFTGILLLLLSQIIVIEFIIFQCSYEKYNSNNTSKWSYIFTILCTIFYILAGISVSCYVLNNGGGFWFQFYGDIFGYIGRLNTYCFFVNNLYYGLKDTPYAISLKTFNSYVTLIIIFVLTVIVKVIIGYNYTTKEVPNPRIDDTIHLIEHYVSLFIDLIISIPLLILFIHKLYKSGVKAQKNYIARRQNAEHLSEYIELKQNLEDNIDDISIQGAKILILCIIIIPITLISVALGFGWWDNPTPIEIIITFYFIRLISVPWLMMLSFDCMDSWYNSCFGICGTKIRNYIIKRLNKKIDVAAGDSIANFENDYGSTNDKKSRLLA